MTAATIFGFVASLLLTGLCVHRKRYAYASMTALMAIAFLTT